MPLGTLFNLQKIYLTRKHDIMYVQRTEEKHMKHVFFFLCGFVLNF